MVTPAHSAVPQLPRHLGQNPGRASRSCQMAKGLLDNLQAVRAEGSSLKVGSTYVPTGYFHRVTSLLRSLLDFGVGFRSCKMLRSANCKSPSAFRILWSLYYNVSMLVIPVLDLKGGQAVHAVRGERADYKPVRGVLGDGEDVTSFGDSLPRSTRLPDPICRRPGCYCRIARPHDFAALPVPIPASSSGLTQAYRPSIRLRP